MLAPSTNAATGRQSSTKEENPSSPSAPTFRPLSGGGCLGANRDARASRAGLPCRIRRSFLLSAARSGGIQARHVSVWRRSMLLDFDVKTCSRECSVTGRAIGPGERYYSVLMLSGAETVRRDFCADAWREPAGDAIGWWQSTAPESAAAKPKLAPNEVLLNLLSELAANPRESQFRYLVALLLLRRRVLRLESTELNDDDVEIMTVFCPRRDETSEVEVAAPAPDEAAQLQDRVAQLLYGEE